MKLSLRLFIISSVASLAAATPAPQLGGLPDLPVCLIGDLGSTLPVGLDLISCAAGQTCTSATDLIASVPILGSILGGIVDELPAGVGLCA